MSDLSDKFITVDDVNLEYRWIGRSNPDKPTLVFLHEGLGSISMWKNFPQQLTEATGLSAFIYSRRGYGKSDPAILPRRINYMHDEALDVLPKVLDAVGIQQAILVGHSDGGSIALIFAATDPKRRSIGLILLAPHVFNEELCVTSIHNARELYKTTSLRVRLSKYHNDVDHTFVGWSGIWLHPDFMHWNIENCLPNLNIPVLHIQGNDDQYGTKAQADAIEQQCQAPVKVVMLSDCGHSIHLDQPQLTINTIKNFVREYKLETTTKRLSSASVPDSTLPHPSIES